MKIMLRIPTNTGIVEELANWLVWYGRQRPEDEIATHYCNKGGGNARNEIVAEFHRSDCDALWMIDYDNVPPYRLNILDHLDTWPVVCGWYYTWRPGGLVPVVYRILDRERGLEFWPREKWPQKAAFGVDGVGAGCMIIRREVLEGHDYPFNYEPVGKGSVKTEDLAFCEAHQGKIGVVRDYWCDHWVRMSTKQVFCWHS